MPDGNHSDALDNPTAKKQRELTLCLCGKHP